MTDIGASAPNFIIDPKRLEELTQAINGALAGVDPQDMPKALAAAVRRSDLPGKNALAERIAPKTAMEYPRR